MRNRKLLLWASAAITVGFVLLSRGTLLLVTAQAEPNVAQSSLVGISIEDNKVLFSGMNIANLVPGDSGEDTLVVKNTGSQKETITMTTTPSGEIFQDNGKTGTSLGTGADASENNTIHGISMDYGSGDGTTKMFEFDNHPLQVSYTLDVNGLNGPVAPIQMGPFSSGTPASQFELSAGETATVTYHYLLPLDAHNDYQSTQGHLDVAFRTVGDTTTPPGQGGNVPGGTSPVTGLPIISTVMEALLAMIAGGVLMVMSRGRSRRR